ncbi:hypothetical protein ZHAS_00020788 [Anopheles sinensis]|uniref:Uncharacterized protein n=1 Tax=Anopheles sinensis TaxID=74873 RepID=A0A084WQP4_ANOSI|nr:hypothetical protein ZHAS_00020788 [Anopheles sinensis]
MAQFVRFVIIKPCKGYRRFSASPSRRVTSKRGKTSGLKPRKEYLSFASCRGVDVPFTLKSFRPILRVYRIAYLSPRERGFVSQPTDRKPVVLVEADSRSTSTNTCAWPGSVQLIRRFAGGDRIFDLPRTKHTTSVKIRLLGEVIFVPLQHANMWPGREMVVAATTVLDCFIFAVDD